MRNRESLTVSDEHIYQYLQNSRREQLLWLTGVTTVMIGLLAALRMLMLGISSSHLVGPLMFSVLTILLIAIKNGLPLKLASALLIATVLIGTTVLATMTGGVHSAVVVILPFIPLVGTILLGRKVGVACAALALGTIGALYLSSGNLIITSEGITGLQPTLAKSAFLAALVVVGTIMAHHQSRISESMAETIWNHATHDYLTGLPNRRHLDSTLERDFGIARRDQSSIATLLIDIDNFKLFNDTRGHLQGDDCLRRVAAALASCLRRPSDIVGRFGGEEFMVIMPGTDAQGASQVAESMRAAVEALNIENTGDEHQLVTISVGICCVAARSAKSSAELIESADQALYAAKTNGRNRVELLKQLHVKDEQPNDTTGFLVIDRAAS